MNAAGRVAGKLWVQVLVATVAGIILGRADPGLGTKMAPLGTAFVDLVRMLIAPIIFFTVVHGIAGMADLRRVGRVVVKLLVYFEAVTAVALAFALVAVDAWRPGVGMHVDPRALGAHAVSGALGHAAKTGGVDAFLLAIIPTTFFSALVQPNVLQVLFVALLFAAGVVAVGERARPIVDLVATLSAVFFRIVGFVMWFAPLGAFGSIAFTVGKFGVGTLGSLGNLIVEFFAVSALFVVVVLGGIARLAGVSLWRLLGYIRDEILVVAATTSTETVLPRVMEKLRDLGCEESVVGLAIPLGYSFNLDGTCLYLSTAAIFLAQATDTHLTVGQQIGLIAVLLLTSKGAAGVAGAAFVVLAATLSTLGTIPVASVALILGIHRILAEALTFVNLVGNCVGTIVISRWEDALDATALAEHVGVRRSLTPRVTTE